MKYLLLVLTFVTGLTYAEDLKRAAVFTDAGSAVDLAMRDSNKCLVLAKRFAMNDAKEFVKALEGKYKFYVFHATDEDVDKWERLVLDVRKSDLKAQVALIADVKESAKLQSMCSKQSVLFMDLRKDSRNVVSEMPRFVAGFMRWCAPHEAGIDYGKLGTTNIKQEESIESVARRTQRLHDAKWGVFNHYLGHGIKTAAEWNRKVNAYDVKLVADQLESCGAKFYFITIMQGRRWLCSPNQTFDRIGGTKPGEATSIRDLPMELAEELEKRGIDLYLYYTGDGPYLDEDLGPKFGLTTARYVGVDERFVKNWTAVLEEYAVRYGSKVKGWWIDGCYGKQFLQYTEELLAYYYRAVKKGNPEALVALNNGVKDYYTKYYSKEDFVCGEFNDFYCVPKSRFIDGAQAFALIPLAAWKGRYTAWGCGGCKRSAEYVANYVDMVNTFDGVVAIDVKVNDNGAWEADQMEVLKAVGRKTGTLKK